MGDGTDSDEVLDVRTADVERAAPDFHKGAEALGKARAALVKALDSPGEPGGHDKQGDEFGDACTPLQKKIESSAGAPVLGLTGVHEATAGMADGYVDDDELIAGIFTDVKVDGRSRGRDELCARRAGLGEGRRGLAVRVPGRPVPGRVRARGPAPPAAAGRVEDGGVPAVTTRWRGRRGAGARVER